MCAGDLYFASIIKRSHCFLHSASAVRKRVAECLRADLIGEIAIRVSLNDKCHIILYVCPDRARDIKYRSAVYRSRD